MDKTQEQRIISVIEGVDDLTIATLRADGFPQATTVSFVNDGLIVYFGTAENSQKAVNISRDNRVSVTINTPYETWDFIVGLSIGGLATAVIGPRERSQFEKLVFDKYPQVAAYVADGSNRLAIFRIDPLVISLLDYTRGFGHTEYFHLAQQSTCVGATS